MNWSRLRTGSVLAGLVVLVLAVGGVLGQQAITTSAFTGLEADQVGQDAQRVRIGLDDQVQLLRSYGATNSIWDGSYTDLRTDDETTFSSDFNPADMHRLFGVDGVLGLAPDGTLRVGGTVAGGRFVTPPAGLRKAAELRRLFDPTAAAGQGRCGVVTTSSAPYLFCGYAAYPTSSTGTPAGGLVYLKSLDGDGLQSLGQELGLTLSLVSGPRSGAKPQPATSSTIGSLSVATTVTGAHRMVLSVAVPTVTGGRVYLETTRPRPIYAEAVSVAHKLVLLMALLALLQYAAQALVLRREVRRQVSPLRRTTERVIASGDRSLRIASTDGGEIGRLAHDIDQMLDAMAAQDESIATGQRSREEQLRHTFVQQRLTAQFVGQRAQQAIGDTVDAVVAELQVVIDQVRDVRASVAGIDDGVRSTEAVTRQAGERAHAGTQTASAVTASLHQVNGIASLIAGVAEQTNLLALNATIESARAGAAGKGFAVVAGEVKQLAQTTSRSTAEIRETLGALERDVNAMAFLITEMTAGVASIGEQTGRLTGVAAEQRDRMASLDGALQAALERIRSMTALTDAIERRTHERTATDAEVTLEVFGRAVTGPMLDVSEGGLRCQVPLERPCPPGTGVGVTMRLGEETARCRAVVIRDKPSDPGRELALEFRDLSTDSRFLLAQYVDALLRDDSA